MIDTLFVDFGEELEDANKEAGEEQNYEFVVEKKTCEKEKVNVAGSSVPR